MDEADVILLHRDDTHDILSPRAGKADLHVAKQRGGPTGTVAVAFQGHYSRLMPLVPRMPHRATPTRALGTSPYLMPTCKAPTGADRQWMPT
ncbi:DnaB-like helicase C-terminal domain-containing protein [Embleya sp. NPDC020886]|uniref:DnaB-like helicase C-terminal domain-containing protein n=1 Tax=Embleya sp. NPDC020886 TaxID=3363980 RepID=UPI0037B0F1F0